MGQLAIFLQKLWTIVPITAYGVGSSRGIGSIFNGLAIFMPLALLHSTSIF